jgi:pilus assembly protein CpaF
MTPERWRHLSNQTTFVEENANEMTFKQCLSYIWDYVAQKKTDMIVASESSVDMSPEETASFINNCISEYINEKKPAVIGFIDENNGLELTKLAHQMSNVMTGYSVLSDAFVDPKITEIQVNTYNSIWVERDGKFERYFDSVTGEPVQFMDSDELLNFTNKLLLNSPSQIDRSESKSIGNAISPEGYRVAAIGPAAMAQDKGKNFSLDKSAALVIRKFSEKVISGQDLISYLTCSDDMDYFVSTLGNNHATVIFGGSTGSGKTVNLQRCIDGIDNDIRVISAEKDSELRLRRFDKDGVLINNVIQLEYVPENPSKKYTNFHNTATNLFNQLLRFTPSTIILGECRSDSEIMLLSTGTNAGHNVMATLHTDTPEHCIERMVQALMRESPGQSKVDVMETVTTSVDIVVIPSRMKDHSRKILYIAEIVGCKVDNGVARPIINMLYEFKQRGYALDPNTGEMKTFGEHIRVNPITPELLKKWSRIGMDPDMYEFLSKPVEPSYDPMTGEKINYGIQTYNGERSPYAFPPNYVPKRG